MFLGFSACVKHDLPEPIIESPVFFIDGSLDEDAIDMSAGVRNYYVIPSFTIDNKNLINYRCKFLSHISSPYDIGSIEFIINSNNISSGDTTLIKTGIFKFYNNAYYDSTDLVEYASQISDLYPITYYWKYRNTTGNDSIFLINKDTVAKYGGNVELRVENSIGFESSYLQSASPDINPLIVDFSFINSGNKLTFVPDIYGGKPPYFINWYDVAGDSVFQDTIPINNMNPKEIRLTVTDAEGRTVVAQKDIVDIASQYLLSSSFIKKIIPATSVYYYAEAEIIYTSLSGEMFSTRFSNNSSEKFIEILEISPYLMDAEGFNTLKLKVRYDCILSSEEGHNKSFKGTGTIVVSIP